MLNIDLAVASFWQLARHWKSEQTAKLELACEGGNLYLKQSCKAWSFSPSPFHFNLPVLLSHPAK